MKIKWNKTTKLTTLLAAIVFLVILPAITIYFTNQYKQILDFSARAQNIFIGTNKDSVRVISVDINDIKNKCFSTNILSKGTSTISLEFTEIKDADCVIGPSMDVSNNQTYFKDPVSGRIKILTGKK